MALHKLKLLAIHIMANTSQIDADLAPTLIVLAQQLGRGRGPLLGELNPILLALAAVNFDHVVRLKCLDESIDHPLGRNRLLILLLVSSGYLFEERDDVVVGPSPQPRGQFKYQLQGFLIARLHEEREPKRPDSDLGRLHTYFETCKSFYAEDRLRTDQDAIPRMRPRPLALELEVHAQMQRPCLAFSPGSDI